MYYPLQVPYLLDETYAKYINYTEEIPPSITDFAICIWQMTPLKHDLKPVNHVILFDGGIDLVIDYDNQQIGYAGMSKTVFDDTMFSPHRFMGVRLKPGAFQQLTGLSAENAMDRFLRLEEIDTSFDKKEWFQQPFENVKTTLINYLEKIMWDKEPDQFVNLFDTLCDHPPETTTELYEFLHYSPRQCQRNFNKHYGISPQKVLSVLRFQYCLKLLVNRQDPDGNDQDSNAKKQEMIYFYDQSHFIRDFKKHIGLSPFEFLDRYTQFGLKNGDCNQFSGINLNEIISQTSNRHSSLGEKISQTSNRHSPLGEKMSQISNTHDLPSNKINPVANINNDEFKKNNSSDKQEKKEMFKNITPNLMVEDVRETIVFYKDVLGFSIIDSVQNEDGIFTFAILQKEGLLLMLHQRLDLIEEYPTLHTDAVHPSLTLYTTVANLEKLFEEVSKKTTVLKEINTTFYGAKEFAVTDNNGYVWTFAQAESQA